MKTFFNKLGQYIARFFKALWRGIVKAVPKFLRNTKDERQDFYADVKGEVKTELGKIADELQPKTDASKPTETEEAPQK